MTERDLEARIAVLSDALKSISKNTCCDNCQEAARVARSALGAYVGLARDHSGAPAQSSQVSTLAKLADKWRVQAKQYDEAAKECYYRGYDDEGDMNDIEGSALFRCATELDTALKSLASQPPAAPVTFQQSELKSAATVETDHRGSSAGNERETCPTCNGCGYSIPQVGQVCDTCEGSGGTVQKVGAYGADSLPPERRSDLPTTLSSFSNGYPAISDTALPCRSVPTRWNTSVARSIRSFAICYDPALTSTEPQGVPETIDTAPKDGSHILAWRIPIGIHITNNTHPPTVVHWFDDPDEPGFYTSVNERAPEHPFNPTHWAPLPEGPR